jgi:tRNA uridine 5-carboxymethylaminomethyl modification enzyme
MYDVIVVGAGHAGCEAAMAAAQMGCRTLLVTMNLDLIATMPCNPGVGGPAKGHLVKEVDALGGEMAHNLDKTFIQIRMLNLSKGPAVRAPRAQADKRLYSLAMKHALERVPNLDLKLGLVEKLLTEGDRVKGVATNFSVRWWGQTVILATGTFLGARIMTGEVTFPAGRAGEFPATGLSASLRELGFTLGRLQTNTPPRIDARTIDFSQTIPQLGSETPLYFSFRQPTSGFLHPEPNPIYPIPHQTNWRHQLPCYLVYTNEETHQIARDNLHRSPIASGFIEGVGPRYCPSFEEKIVRFARKDSHQFFLEPEGWRTTEVYVQGMYTAMPYEVQLAMLHSIPALREAEIVRPGYAVEYDFVYPDQIKASLETERVEGLFHAGQINGTSGYEEAAAQGIMAGINAARTVQGKAPIVLRRDQAYIGVLIDDLVTKEIAEPYRMMTSRAEYRLLLRQDNADLRLSPIGYEVGLLSRGRYEAVEEKRKAIEGELKRLEETWLAPSEEVSEKLTARGLDPLNDGVNALQFLRRPEASYELIEALVPSPRPLPPEAIEQVTIEAKYTGYIEKQRREVERVKRLEERPIPDEFDYEVPLGLSNEAREKLGKFRPATVGQASRISGVNPPDISILLVYLEKAAPLSDSFPKDKNVV